MTKVLVGAIFCSEKLLVKRLGYKMDLLGFYRQCADLVRLDLKKQKMLLPPDSIAELCSQHHRKHRELAAKLSGNELSNIYALQKAFPRSGTVNVDFNALEAAKKFAAQKAVALAVVTEKHFYCGEPSMLTGVAHLVDLPIIRWDFIMEPYQLMQSRLWGADAVRIIVPLLDQIELAELYKKAMELELEIIWEIHSAADIERISAFEQSGILYWEGEMLELELAESIVKNLPLSTPALFNGDCFSDNDLPEKLFAGKITFKNA